MDMTLKYDLAPQTYNHYRNNKWLNDTKWPLGNMCVNIVYYINQLALIFHHKDLCQSTITEKQEYAVINKSAINQN